MTIFVINHSDRTARANSSGVNMILIECETEAQAVILANEYAAGHPLMSDDSFSTEGFTVEPLAAAMASGVLAVRGRLA